MRQWRPILVSLIVAGLVPWGEGCRAEQELACRTAVRRLVAAPPAEARAELKRLTEHFGARALPDIEQELQVSPEQGRLRLLEALERIGSAEALPLAAFVARWDSASAVRQRAATLARSLRRAARR